MESVDNYVNILNKIGDQINKKSIDAASEIIKNATLILKENKIKIDGETLMVAIKTIEDQQKLSVSLWSEISSMIIKENEGVSRQL